MYQEHYTFHTPDHSKTVWRYIDFTKLVDLLINEQLYFCRSDKFEDPFEGTFRWADFKEGEYEFSSREMETKKFYFLNCWHINEVQSDAMWKIFLETKNGVALKSTVGDIINALAVAKDDVHIGEVYYRDYSKVTFWELMNEEQNKIPGGPGSSLNQFNYKRLSFEHEKELRLYHVDTPIPHAQKGIEPREPLTEKRIAIDVDTLVNEIVVAPFAEEWFVKLVSQLVSRLERNFPVTQSDLYQLK